MPRRSAPRVSSPRRFHDRPVGRLAGAARSRPVARHAGHRGRTDRRNPLRRAVGRSRRPLPFTATTSCPGSSTCTCTASRASTRWIRCRATARSRRSPPACRATASPRFVRRPWRAGRRRCAACSIRCAARAKRRRRDRRACCPRTSRATSSTRSTAARSPRPACAALGRRSGQERAGRAGGGRTERSDFTAADILAEIERAAPDVGIVTLASELDGGLDLVRWLVVARTSRVAGPLRRDLRGRRSRRSRRARGTRRTSSTGCRRSVTARRAWSARCCRPTRSPRSSSATASTSIRRSSAPRSPPSGRRGSSRSPTAPPPPACRSVARPCSAASAITAGEQTALLPDGTIAGSVLTMDRAFQMLIGPRRSRAGRRGDDLRHHSRARARPGRTRRAGARRRGRPGRPRREFLGGSDLRRAASSSTPEERTEVTEERDHTEKRSSREIHESPFLRCSV